MSREFVCPDCGAVYEVFSDDVRDAAVVCWDDGTVCRPSPIQHTIDCIEAARRAAKGGKPVQVPVIRSEDSDAR